jgi:hypothetical protein
MSHPNDDPREAEKYKQMGEVAYMAEKQREAFLFIRTHPLDTVNFMFRRFVENWIAETDSPADVWAHVPLYVRFFMLLNMFLTLMTFLGAMFARRVNHPAAPPLVTVLLVFPLIFYLTHSSLRYRFPIDPIMMVLSAYGVSFLLSQMRKRGALALHGGAASALPPSQIPSDAD